MNLRPTLEKLYKEGSYGGQCFTFLHKLIEFPPVGTFLGEKYRNLLKFGIPIEKLDSLKVGDILLTNESKTYGHGALINAILGSDLQLTESNFKYNLKVSHSRLLNAHSPKIFGVFRGKYKFELPPVQYPIQIRLDILMNKQPFWNSLLTHMAQLQNWFWIYSGQRIQLIIDYKQTNLSGWPVKVTGNGIGPLYKIIDPVWFKENVLPLSDAKIVVLCVPKSEGLGPTINNPNLYEMGYTYTDKNRGQIFVAHDEKDDYAPYYSNLAALAKMISHEVSHWLYMTAAGENVVPGGDYTHNWFYGENNYPLKPEGIFQDIDYSKLT